MNHDSARYARWWESTKSIFTSMAIRQTTQKVCSWLEFHLVVPYSRKNTSTGMEMAGPRRWMTPRRYLQQCSMAKSFKRICSEETLLGSMLSSDATPLVIPRHCLDERSNHKDPGRFMKWRVWGRTRCSHMIHHHLDTAFIRILGPLRRNGMVILWLLGVKVGWMEVLSQRNWDLRRLSNAVIFCLQNRYIQLITPFEVHKLLLTSLWSKSIGLQASNTNVRAPLRRRKRWPILTTCVNATNTQYY